MRGRETIGLVFLSCSLLFTAACQGQAHTDPNFQDRTLTILVNMDTKSIFYYDHHGVPAEKMGVNRNEKITMICLDMVAGDRLEFEIEFKNGKSCWLNCNPKDPKCKHDKVVTAAIHSDYSRKIKGYITPSATAAPDDKYPYIVRIFSNGGSDPVMEIDPEFIIPPEKKAID